MPVLVVVFLFITAIVLGPLIIIFTFVHFRRREINKRELQVIQSQISEIKVDIEDIKEQIADFIIKTS